MNIRTRPRDGCGLVNGKMAAKALGTGYTADLGRYHRNMWVFSSFRLETLGVSPNCQEVGKGANCDSPNSSKHLQCTRKKEARGI